jgi:hypothetical protein
MLGRVGEFEHELIRNRTAKAARLGVRREDGTTRSSPISRSARRANAAIIARIRLRRLAAVTTCPAGRFGGWCKRELVDHGVAGAAHIL